MRRVSLISGVLMVAVSAAHAQGAADPAPPPPPPPDLAVLSISTFPVVLAGGGEVRIDAQVANLGFSASPPAELCTTVWSGDRLLTLVSSGLGAIASGQTVTNTVRVVAPASDASLVIEAFADCGRRLAEVDEANNILRIEVPSGGSMLAFLPVMLPVGRLDTRYAARLGAGGGRPPYRFFAAGLPSGLTMAPEGAIDGVPTAVGQFEIDARVTDSSGQAARILLSLTIAPADGLRILTTELPGAVLGEEYCAGGLVRVEAAGGTPPYTWIQASAPLGMGVEPDGALCGIPLGIPGADRVDLAVIDARGDVARATLTVLISEPMTKSPLTLAPFTLPDASVGVAYAATIPATGGAPPYAFRLRAGDVVPQGLVLDGDGRLHGTPVAIDSRVFTVEVRDVAGDFAGAEASLVVRDPARPLLAEAAPVGCGCTTSDEGPWSSVLIAAAVWFRRRRRV